MKVINLFGAPGAGKSTTARELTSLLNRLGYNVEYVNEFAKKLVWHMRFAEMGDQAFITGVQHHELYMLNGQVDYVVTDSPLLLGLIYGQGNSPDTYFPFVLDLFKRYDNINFYIHRVNDYNPVGRNQSEEESNGIALDVKELLESEKITYQEVDGNENAAENLLKYMGLHNEFGRSKE